MDLTGSVLLFNNNFLFLVEIAGVEQMVSLFTVWFTKEFLIEFDYERILVGFPDWLVGIFPVNCSRSCLQNF